MQGLGSLEEDDPNILLAIQLSLQDSGMVGIGSNHEIFANEASLGAIGTSLPSRLEQSTPGVEVLPRACLSSSELLELEDNFARLNNISCQHSVAPGVSISAQHCDSQQWANRAAMQIPLAPGDSNSTGLFSSSTDTTDLTTCSSHDASSSSALTTNANLLGNIMAWFHDMNPQGISLVPPTSSGIDANMGPLRGGCLQDDEKSEVVVLTENRKTEEVVADVAFSSQSLSGMEEKGSAIAERPTHLDLVGLGTMPLPYMAALDTSGESAECTGSKACHVSSPQRDSVSDQLPSTSSSEWEEQVHLV